MSIECQAPCFYLSHLCFNCIFTLGMLFTGNPTYKCLIDLYIPVFIMKSMNFSVCSRSNEEISRDVTLNVSFKFSSNGQEKVNPFRSAWPSRRDKYLFKTSSSEKCLVAMEVNNSNLIFFWVLAYCFFYLSTYFLDS